MNTPLVSAMDASRPPAVDAVNNASVSRSPDAPKRSSFVKTYGPPLAVGIVGLVCIGSALFLAFRAQRPEQLDATIDDVQADGDTKKLSLRYSIAGRGEIRSVLVVPDRPECVYLKGRTLRVRYDPFLPEVVSLERNPLLLVGAASLGGLGLHLSLLGMLWAMRRAGSRQAPAKAAAL